MPLIINADDFGASNNINNSILQMHKLRIVSSTTIIANGNNFEQAIIIAKKNPRLGIGVHLCLDGPYNIGTKYTTIINQETNQFYNVVQVVNKLKYFSFLESEIYQEYCLQIEKVLDNQIKISHLDHHHHLHLYLPSLRCIIKAANKYKIPYIRTQKVLFRNNQNAFNTIYRNIHHIILRNKVKTIDGLFEPLITDNSSNSESYKRLSELIMLKNKTIEIMLHPFGQLNQEYVFFTSEKVLDLLSNQKIINYNDLLKT
ncbi:MAG: ChbG/HpnK family deacetylase [Flavobacterium sp.]|nr:ChbG/HpnK family deacetylase [Flavobacterium sp.]